MTSSRDVLLEEIASRVVPQGRRLGLVIGIDQYGDSSGIPRLNAAVADAKAMHAAMIDPACGRFAAEQTRLIFDGDATDSRIRIELERLRKTVTANDEVWFFYAGHALLVDGEHRLLPVNAQREFLDATSVDFPALFNKIKCRRKIVFLDCCHAGASDASTRNLHDVEDVFRSYDASGTITYCSSESDQKSVELQEQGHGAFTYWLERGPRGDADVDGSGVVTSDELWNYVCAHVEEDARRLTGRTQTPRLKADTSGAFALSVNINAIRARSAKADVEAAARTQIREQLEAHRGLLRRLLGEDDHAHLSTVELKAALKVLEGEAEGRTARQIRKALDEFRDDGNAEDATVHIRGALALPSAAPSFEPPRKMDTNELVRRVAAEVAARSGTGPAIPSTRVPAADAATPAPTPDVPTASVPAPKPVDTPAPVHTERMEPRRLLSARMPSRAAGVSSAHLVRVPRWRLGALVGVAGVIGVLAYSLLKGPGGGGGGDEYSGLAMSAAPAPDSAPAILDSAAGEQAEAAALPDVVRATYAGRQMVFSDVHFNGKGNRVAAAPGDTLLLTFNWRLDVDEGLIFCPTCIVQSYVGLNEDTHSEFLCHYSSITTATPSATAAQMTIIAPSRPGTYHVRQWFTLEYQCARSRGNGSTGSGVPIGTIIVNQ